MRLTPNLVLCAPQGNDCIGQRTLSLRDKAIPVIENLAVANDSFDTIDLSANAISILGDGFPPFARLSSLYLGNNRISKIQKGVADSLPNLRSLILTGNRIATRSNLNIDELARFQKLEILSLIDNPVSDDPDLKLLLLRRIPSLRFINFYRVTQNDRLAAVEKYGEPEVSAAKNAALGKNEKSNAKKRKRKSADGSMAKKRRQSAPKTFVVGQLDDNADRDKSLKSVVLAEPGKKAKVHPLSAAELERLSELINKASTIEEVLRLQTAVKNGTVQDILNSQEQNRDS